MPAGILALNVYNDFINVETTQVFSLVKMNNP